MKLSELINEPNPKYSSDLEGNPIYENDSLIFQNSSGHVGIGFNGTGLDPSSTLHIYDKDGNSVSSRMQNSPSQYNQQVLGTDGKTTVTTSGTYAIASPNVVVGGTTANAKAILDVQSTTKVFCYPRMTSAQRIAISSPPEGGHVYDTTLKSDMFYDGNAWVQQ